MKNMKAMDFVPTTVIGTALILLAIYLLGIGILTVLLPISEQTSGLLLALHLIIILISVLSLVIYIQKQKK